MPKFLRLSALASGALVAGTALVDAATVTRQSGDVLANDGRGFIAVSAPVELAAGGQILIRPGGSAVIRYANGCMITVGSERVWVIQDKPPCEPGRAIDLTHRMNGGSLKDTPE